MGEALMKAAVEVVELFNDYSAKSFADGPWLPISLHGGPPRANTDFQGNHIPWFELAHHGAGHRY